MALAALLLSPVAAFAAHLERVVEVEGTITDVTPQRVLYFTVEDGQPRLKVFNRVTGSRRTIPDVGLLPVNERLTSRGVIFGITEDLGTAVYEWTGGTPVVYDGTPRGLQVSPLGRQFAVFPVWIGGEGRFLMLRDVLARTSTRVGNGRVQDLADVADGGDVVYAAGPEPYNVYRFRQGQTTQLTQAQGYSHYNPLTDGVNVVYRRQVSATASQIVLHSDTLGEVVLRAESNVHFAPRADYLPGGGWTAFTRVSTVGADVVRQVWLRSPQGQLSAISSGQADAYIHAVAAGQVMFVSGGYLYLGRPGAVPVLVSPFAEGTQASWLRGIWHVHFGGVLYRVVL